VIVDFIIDWGVLTIDSIVLVDFVRRFDRLLVRFTTYLASFSLVIDGLVSCFVTFAGLCCWQLLSLLVPVVPFVLFVVSSASAVQPRLIVFLVIKLVHGRLICISFIDNSLI